MTINQSTTMAIASGFVLAVASTANAVTLKVTVENIAPSEGLIVSRLWTGFHDGSFNIFDFDEPAADYLERLAEDAIVEPTADFPSTITTAFANSGAGDTQGTILGPTGMFRDFLPGDRAEMTFTLDASLPTSRYFSYGAMILPSNDAFIANNNPLAFELFEAEDFLGADFTVTGAEIWDAGTEVSDEIPENTAALAQAAPNTGVSENGLVTPHPGFITGGNILQARPNADFTTPNYPVARITVEKVPEPTAITGLLICGGFIGAKMMLQFKWTR